MLPVAPTRTHPKGEEFFAGPRAGHLRGRTGMGFLATDKLVPSDRLDDHFVFVEQLLYSATGEDSRIRKLRDILQRTHSCAHVTCFWRGESGEPAARIPNGFRSAIAPLAADIETDFTIEQRL